MELHRTDLMRSSTGQLVPVVTIGVAPHEGKTRELVLGLKYDGIRRNANELARMIVPAIPEVRQDQFLLTWAPTSTAHRLERGMDHAELIARHAGAFTRLKVGKLLRRINQEAQTGLARHARLVGPEFIARPLRNPLHVIVIDDVVTTGATFHAAARALVHAGARAITCIAPSRTV